MQWWEVSVACQPQDAETVATFMLAWPEVQGALYEGYSPGGPLHPEYGEWFAEELSQQTATETRVKVYLPEWVTESQMDERMNLVVESVGDTEVDAGTLTWTYRRVDESEWDNAWQQEFNSIPVGNSLMIVPKWDRDEPVPDGREAIYLEPGRAFGTGVHATTQMCMEILETIVQPQTKVLDVGCGTGVLSIAALRLGAADVTAVDVDPVAVKVTQENAADNGVERTLKVQQSDLLKELRPETYDVVLANILRDIVIRLIPAVEQQLEPGGQVVLSGFLESDVPAVTQALHEAGLQMQKALQREDWAAVLAVKPS